MLWWIQSRVLIFLIFIFPAVDQMALRSKFQDRALKDKVRDLKMALALVLFNYQAVLISCYIQRLWCQFWMYNHLLTFLVLFPADEVPFLTVIIRFLSFWWSAGLWSDSCCCTHRRLLHIPAQVWIQRSEAGKLISLNYALLCVSNCTFLCKPHHLVAHYNQ